MIFRTHNHNFIRRHKQARGGALIETIIVLPVIVMIGFAVMDYSYFFFLKNTIQGAAVTGARAAILSTATNTTVDTAISTMLNAAGIATNEYTVTKNPSNVATATANQSVTITITATWGTVGTHMVSTTYGGISSSKQIQGVAVMQKEP